MCTNKNPEHSNNTNHKWLYDERVLCKYNRSRIAYIRVYMYIYVGTMMKEICLKCVAVVQWTWLCGVSSSEENA